MAITLSGRVEGTVNNGLARQGVSSNFVPFHSSDTSNPFPKNIHLQHIKYAEGAINNHHDSLHDCCSNRPYCRSVHLTEAVSFPRRRPLHLWSLRGGATASRRIHPHHIPCAFTRHAVGGMLTFSYSQSTPATFKDSFLGSRRSLLPCRIEEADIKASLPAAGTTSKCSCATVRRLDCAAATGRMDWRRKDQRRDSTPPFLTGASQLAVKALLQRSTHSC